MASLRKKPQQRYWVACFTDASGKQRQASTRSVKRDVAMAIAEGYEAAWRNQQTEAQVRRSMAAIFEKIHGESLCRVTLDQWFATWLARVKPEIAPNTFARYEETTKLVRKLAPDMVSKVVDRIEAKHVLDLRAALMKTRARGTVNLNLKIFRQCLKAAWVAGLIPENPAAKVASVRAADRNDVVAKRPFTADELRALMAAADDEWRGMILAGLYSAGQRLSDIATMTAGQVDLTAGEVNFLTDKTGRGVIVPIVAPWMADLRRRMANAKPDSRLFPRAYGQFVEGGGVGRISNSFRRILARCKLATKSNRAREGAVTGRRVVSALSFHSFRHTATSMLKNGGVSDAVARDIVGHESEAVSANYTHIDRATKRTAMDLLPDIAAGV